MCLNLYIFLENAAIQNNNNKNSKFLNFTDSLVQKFCIFPVCSYEMTNYDCMSLTHKMR